MKKLMLLALLAAGCEDFFKVSPPAPEVKQVEVCDATARERIFLGCLERLPGGPDKLTVSGNDWAEAVEEAVDRCRYGAQAIACKYEWVTVGEKR